MQIIKGIGVLALVSTILVGCSDHVAEQQSVNDYNAHITNIKSNYESSKVKAKKLDIEFRKSILGQSSNIESYLKTENNLAKYKTFEETFTGLVDSTTELAKNQRQEQKEKSNKFATYSEDLLNFDINKDLDKYVKVNYFMDDSTGNLIQMYRITLPIEGYSGLLRIIWSGGEVIEVEEYRDSM